MLREGTERSKDSHHFTPARWNEFAQHLHYLAGPIDSPEFYPTLQAAIEQLSANGDKPNVLFYLSLPPSAVPDVIRYLGNSGLAHAAKGWTRIIIEKPFGRDLASARALNQTVLAAFDEEQVFRIDHYLGKQTVQNILVFRFANSHVRAHLASQLRRLRRDHRRGDARRRNRAGFYEETGAPARHGCQPYAPASDPHRDGASCCL